jgi:Spy/CpxP family protein refolding chaperone
MKKSIAIGIFVAFILTLVLPGLAQRNWQPRMSPTAGMNLTSEQIAKIQKLTLQFQKDILPMEIQIQTLYMEVGPLPYRDTEQAKFNAAFKKIDTLEMELEKKYMVYENQIRAILTEEQKAFFDQWGGLGYGLERMGLGMGMGMGFGRGYAGYGRASGNYGRGYAGYGRASGNYGRGYAGYSRGYGQGWNRGIGRGWGRGPGMGRGYWCPWFQQGIFNRFRNWW